MEIVLDKMLWWLLLTVALIFLYFFYIIRERYVQFKIAEKDIFRQFEKLSKEERNDFVAAFFSIGRGNELLMLISRIESKCTDGCLRIGHVTWAIRELRTRKASEIEDSEIPTFIALNTQS
ncbi:hypothetical protein HR45_03140 [Shewanella mangrovi]|uniref:Uncharacterized protein n=1 Tax=Shewanella mangrovi TaxID=1515746 RepID=A0A094JEW8_9GAMM|nr:hypothetical protein [Shewanella mangrovi]KFZ38445.1 hypothetical protein HR45_03140 [Shewanella mangrovi]